jgi:hypothetical protein
MVWVIKKWGYKDQDRFLKQVNTSAERKKSEPEDLTKNWVGGGGGGDRTW